MGATRTVTIAFAVLSATTVAAADGPLVFVAASVHESYSGKDAILLRLTLENASPPGEWGSPFFVLIPWLTFGWEPKPWPCLSVEFKIVDPDGLVLVPKPEAARLQKLVPPDPSWFTELHAGQFLGTVVDLRAPWRGFSFAKPGTYTVTATVSSRARLWLDGWLRQHHRQRDALLFSYTDVFEGALATKPVRISVTE